MKHEQCQFQEIYPFPLQLDSAAIRKSNANMAHSTLNQKKGKMTEQLEEKVLAPPQGGYSND